MYKNSLFIGVLVSAMYIAALIYCVSFQEHTKQGKLHFNLGQVTENWHDRSNRFLAYSTASVLLRCLICLLIASLNGLCVTSGFVRKNDRIVGLSRLSDDFGDLIGRKLVKFYLRD